MSLCNLAYFIVGLVVGASAVGLWLIRWQEGKK